MNEGATSRDSPTSDGENRKPHALAHRTLVDEQVGEVHAVEYVIDLPLQHHPHRPDAAALRLRAPLLTDGVRHAVQVERAELGGGDHLAHRDVLGRAGERIPTPRTARAVHEAVT